MINENISLTIESSFSALHFLPKVFLQMSLWLLLFLIFFPVLEEMPDFLRGFLLLLARELWFFLAHFGVPGHAKLEVVEAQAIVALAMTKQGQK